MATGEIPPKWQENPCQLAQKDADAKWTQKTGKSYFGDKDYISVDAKHGFIRRYGVTGATVHDRAILIMEITLVQTFYFKKFVQLKLTFYR